MSDYGRVFRKSNLRRITLQRGERSPAHPARFGSTRHDARLYTSRPGLRSQSYVNGRGITRSRDDALLS